MRGPSPSEAARDFTSKTKSKLMTLNRRTFLIHQALTAAALLTIPLPARAQAPSAEEIKTLAEEAFIYGLPLVMNYAVMYEYAVDTKSSQFKAPFNQLASMHRVATYADTAIITPNSDTPYSLLWLDLRAEPIVLSVPAVEKNRYYAVMLEDGNTFI